MQIEKGGPVKHDDKYKSEVIPEGCKGITKLMPLTVRNLLTFKIACANSQQKFSLCPILG